MGVPHATPSPSLEFQRCLLPNCFGARWFRKLQKAGRPARPAPGEKGKAPRNQIQRRGSRNMTGDDLSLASWHALRIQCDVPRCPSFDWDVSKCGSKQMPGYAQNTAPPFLELIPTPMNSRCLEAASPQFGCGLVKHGLQSTNVRCHGKQALEAASSAHEQKPSLLYMACLRYVRLRGSHKRSHLLLGFVWWGLACLTT